MHIETRPNPPPEMPLPRVGDLSGPAVTGAGGGYCPACGAHALTTFVDLGDMPVHIGILWPTAEAARTCRRGHLRLAFCGECSFITNIAFRADRLDYGHPYDNELGYSGVYRQYEHGLIKRLTRDHGLNGKRILEIGCGSGRFLRALCAEGRNVGIGFDPSLDGDLAELEGPVRFVRDYYPGDHGPVGADLVVCRQVFEHIPQPLDFLRSLRRTLANGYRASVYFEVPNFEHVLEELAIWTIIYEHCSYYRPDALAQVFSRAGFQVTRMSEDYQGQFIGLEAVPAHPANPQAFHPEVRAAVRDRIMSFVIRLEQKLSNWRAEMDDLRARGRRAVVWGAGARAVCFCNILNPGDAVPLVVDINPGKAGRFLPGTGQPIVGPEALATARPDVIIVMNEIYADEIRRTVAGLGLRTEFLQA
jgi:SAM-dependent methyltransferase